MATEFLWRDRLVSLEMPTRLARQARTGQPGQGEHLRELDPQMARQLASFTQDQKVTLNTLVQAAWALLLQRHCGQETVAFGATVVGRPAELPGIEAQIGLFINILPVIAAPQPQQSVAEYLQGMQAPNLALCEHEYTPLYDTQRWVGHGDEALFDSILVLENFSVAKALRQAPADLELSTPGNHERINCPLVLGVTLGERLSLQYAYARCDLDAADIAELDHHLLHLLRRMVKIPQAALGELALFDAGERQEALRDWQAPFEALPRSGVAAASAYRAASAPEAVALVCGNKYLSYAELDMRAERPACGLRARGAAAEALVATTAERSFDLVVGLLGISKAGAGYLSLDPNYLAERLAYMLRDSGACWLICQETLAERLSYPAEVERLSLGTAAWPAGADTRPLSEIAGETLIYVIYTSGSTGQPKGVAVSQVAPVVHCQAAVRTYGIGPGDYQLQFVSISFDAVVEQLFVPLLARARVLLGDAGQWSAQHLADEVERHVVAILDLPPAYLQQQAEELRHAGHRIAVRACILGDEAWDASLLIQQAVQAEVWFNAYGPTEVVITPLVWHCRT